jgi:hypothetical protein
MPLLAPVVPPALVVPPVTGAPPLFLAPPVPPAPPVFRDPPDPVEPPTLVVPPLPPVLPHAPPAWPPVPELAKAGMGIVRFFLMSTYPGSMPAPLMVDASDPALSDMVLVPGWLVLMAGQFARTL